MRFSVCLFLGLLGFSFPGAAEILYTVTSLGTLGPRGSGSLGLGLNNLGQVTGYADTYGGLGQFAFLYRNGHMTNLGTLPGTVYSGGQAINDAGQVTGYTGYSGHAFLYRNGQMTDLGTLEGGCCSGGYGINHAGQVAGGSAISATRGHAVLYSNGQMQDLGTLPGDSGSSGFGINNAGQVVGSSSRLTSLPNSYQYHAFLYSDGQMKELGTLGGQSSRAYGINEAGQVTGVAQTSTGASHAFLYQSGQMTDLGTLGGLYSQGYGINNAGQVVGYFYTSVSAHAFLYRNGQMLDLNSLIDPALHITLGEATAINDQGQIVANDGFGYGEGGTPAPHAYLLTPIPEPSTLALFAVALLGFGARTRRHFVRRNHP